MDDPTRELIRQLAEKTGLDPEQLQAALSSDNLPEALQQIIHDTLGDITLFDQALRQLNDE